MNSKKLPSKKLAATLAHVLGLDALDKTELLEALSRDLIQEKGLGSGIESPSFTSEVHEIQDHESVLLKNWFNIALLEFSGCENFVENPRQIASLFAVSEAQANCSLQELLQAGFLTRDKNGKLKKANGKMRLPTTRSRAMVREFHEQMLRKAITDLKTHTDSESFQARLTTGYTVALNPEKLEEAKVILHKALIQIATLMCTGECSQVYQLQAQLFPLGDFKKTKES